MDKLEKSLYKLNKHETVVAMGLIKRIISGDLKNLDVKKLKGHEDAYRVRKGSLRVIFRKIFGEIVIIGIGRRNETTYRK